MLREKETYKYLGKIEVDTMKQAEMKTIEKEYPSWMRKLLETKLWTISCLNFQNQA